MALPTLIINRQEFAGIIRCSKLLRWFVRIPEQLQLNPRADVKGLIYKTKIGLRRGETTTSVDLSLLDMGPDSGTINNTENT